MEPNLIAVSTGPDARWSWQILSRNGRLLRKSADTFASLSEALHDGRRHLQDEPRAPRSLRDAHLTGR